MKRIIEGAGVVVGLGLAAFCGVSLFKDLKDDDDFPYLDEIGEDAIEAEDTDDTENVTVQKF